MKNITYLLGAGASYNAYPILSELGNKMIELSDIYFKLKDEGAFNDNEYIQYLDRTFKDMRQFGEKAGEYGTIDTYAKKLYLNRNIDSVELKNLKLSISLFFTIWFLTDDKRLKTMTDRQVKQIDTRYIALLATILEKKENDIFPKIPENINFVTWNYDLQLEYALKLFTNQKITEVLDANTSKICHLNGYHEFYNTRDTGKHSLDERDELKERNGKTSTEIKDIIDAISFVPKEHSQNGIDIASFINYAWENDNYIVSPTRQQAEEIFSKTDILIVIGYSFPTFNKEVDFELFSQLNKNVKVYYQDKVASKEKVSQLISEETIELKKDISQFFLPYSY